MLHAALLIAAVLSYVPPGLPATRPPNAIYDGAHLLNPAETAQVAEEIAAEANAGVEAAVVTFADTDGNGPRPIAHEIQTTWNLSPKSVVYLITLKPKFIWIQPGEAFSDTINSSDSERIARTEIAPRFRQAAFGAGILAGMREVRSIVTRTSPTPVESVPVSSSAPTVAPVPEEHASHTGLWILLGIFGLMGGYYFIKSIAAYRRRRMLEMYPEGESVQTIPPISRTPFADDKAPLRERAKAYSAPRALDPYVLPTKVTNIDSNNFNLAVIDLATPTPTPTPSPAPSTPAPSPSYSRPSTPAPTPRYDSPSRSRDSDSGSGSSWGGFSSDSGGGSSWGSDSGGGFDFGGGGGSGGGYDW